MDIVLNEIQQDAQILFVLGLLIVVGGGVGIHYSSVCIESLPLNSHVPWDQVPGIDVFIDYINVMV